MQLVQRKPVPVVMDPQGEGIVGCDRAAGVERVTPVKHRHPGTLGEAQFRDCFRCDLKCVVEPVNQRADVEFQLKPNIEESLWRNVVRRQAEFFAEFPFQGRDLIFAVI
jgi:hypothetical protein